VASVGSSVEPFSGPDVVLFGHSFGALVAFETARWLRRRGRPLPGALVVAGRTAAHVPGRAAPLHPLPNDRFLAAVAERYGDVIPEEVRRHAELVEVLLPSIRADIRMSETYIFEEQDPLACPIVAYAGDDDPNIAPGEARAWSELTSASFAMQTFRGGHFFLYEAEAEAQLLRDLRARMR
jgi:surfactin synthase thioesterase subunit